MNGAISFSLFGYSRVTPTNCFEWDTYARGFFVNARINRVIYPEWTTVLNIDQESYNSPYKPIFDWLVKNTKTQIEVFPNNDPLCKAMLRRLCTVFAYNHPKWRWDRVLCRDTDSIGTYREAQAVAQWVQENKAVHCITDSISHNIPLMGGMIGMQAGQINDRLRITTRPENAWDKLIEMNPGIDFNRKGSDQEFLMRIVWPKVQDSVTEHYVLGMRQNIPEGSGRHYSIPDIEIPVDPIHKFLNTCAGHIGSSGYYEPPMLKWLNTIDPYRKEYVPIQKQFSKLFFWQY